MEQRAYSPSQKEQYIANIEEDAFFEKPTEHCIVDPNGWKEPESISKGLS